MGLMVSACANNLYVGASSDDTSALDSGALDSSTLTDGETSSISIDTETAADTVATDDTASDDTGSDKECNDESAVDENAFSSDQMLPVGIRPLNGFENTVVGDPYIMLGPDDYYYLTGTTAPDVSKDYDGIELWRSRDLSTWEYLGFVWTFANDAEEGSWYSLHYPYPVGDETVYIRVPQGAEIHYINGKWWIAFAVLGGGTGILKSTSDQPEGPYENAITGEKGYIAQRHVNPSLFQDDDGTVYYIEDNAAIAPMREDLSGVTEPLSAMSISGSGNDGASLFKAFGHYYLSLAKYYNDAEDSYVHVVEVADDIYGPYGQPHEVIYNQPGDLTFFRDKACQWWMTLSIGADDFHAGTPAIAPVEFDTNHLIRLDSDRLPQ